VDKYIDGFAFPILEKHLDTYKDIVEKVAAIWKSNGALDYVECLSDELNLEGTRSFADALEAKEDEVIIFGWLTFPSRKVRDLAHQNVAADPIMAELVEPLMRPGKQIFNPQRMVFCGFKSFIG